MSGQAETFFVKSQSPGSDRWFFVETNGRRGRLKVHALRFADREKAQAWIDFNGPLNASYKFKVVGQ